MRPADAGRNSIGRWRLKYLNNPAAISTGAGITGWRTAQGSGSRVLKADIHVIRGALGQTAVRRGERPGDVGPVDTVAVKPGLIARIAGHADNHL